MNTLNTIPEGYRINAQGHLVPESQIKPLDKLRDEMVLGIVEAELPHLSLPQTSPGKIVAGEVVSVSP